VTIVNDQVTYLVNLVHYWVLVAAILKIHAKQDFLGAYGISDLFMTVDEIEKRKASCPLITTGIHGVVRHPQMFLNILNLFITAKMSADRFLFGVSYMIYTFAAIPYEENLLLQTFGEKYREYQMKVSALIPFVSTDFWKKMKHVDPENKKETPKNK